jgi:hypothetical protein
LLEIPCCPLSPPGTSKEPEITYITIPCVTSIKISVKSNMSRKSEEIARNTRRKT